MALADAHLAFRKELLICHLLNQQINDTPPANIAQTHRLRESIFLNAYVAVERLLEGTFLAYALGEPTLSGIGPVRYLVPKNEQHAYEMIRSSQPFLDWTSPDVVVQRCETYFQNGDPLKSKITSAMDLLRHAKRVRNYLTHRSRESVSDFKKTENSLLPTPLLVPASCCGDFLSLVPSAGPCRRVQILTYFLNGLSDFGDSIVT